MIKSEADVKRFEELQAAQRIIMAAEQEIRDEYRNFLFFAWELIRGLPGHRAFMKLSRAFYYLDGQIEEILS